MLNGTMEKKVILISCGLRDNCSTSRDKDSRHRMFNLLEVSTNIAPKQFKINNRR